MVDAHSRREQFLSVDVDGPVSFTKALRRADRTLQRTFSAAIRGAGRKVRDKARARYRGRFRQRSGRSVKGITSREAGGTARVRLEKSKPWLVGQEWGGYATRFHPHNLPVLRGGTSGVGGTFLWPAATESITEVTEATEAAIDTAMKTLSGSRRGLIR